MRLYRRFFRHAEFLLSGLGPAEQRLRGNTWRWQAIFYRNSLLELPSKLAWYAQSIDYRAFPANTPERVQALVSSLYDLAFRIRDLVEAREQPHSELAVNRLREELRAWHQIIDRRLQSRADDPAQLVEPSANLRKRLAARLDRLEASVEELFAQADKGELSTADRRNLFRLLGSYRGLSEAEIGSAQLAEEINWAQWQEARF